MQDLPNDNAHAKFSPSKLPRLIRCPGSYSVTKDLEETTSVYAEEGTMLHEVTEHCLRANMYRVPKTLKYKYNLSNENAEAVQDILDWVVALHLQHADDNTTDQRIETQVSLAPLAITEASNSLKDVYGTLDYCFIVPGKKILYVVDWKYGRGVEVWPDSEQLKAYALGAISSLSYLNIDKTWKIIQVIGQPRLYGGEPFKIYETNTQDLYNWTYYTLAPALKDAESDDPTFSPTDKGCMWCGIKLTCEHRRRQRSDLAAQVFDIFAKLPHKTDEEEVSEFLKKLPTLKSCIADIEMHAINLVKAGKLTDWKLVPGRSIRKWKDEKKAKQYYFENTDFEFEDLTITKFKSPTQIEKLVGKKNVTEEMLDLVIKPDGKPTLVHETDPRDAIEFETVEQKFSKFAE